MKIINRSEYEESTIFENIYEVDCFQKEFEQVTSEKIENKNGRYHKWLRKQLNFLDEYGMNALQFENFEVLKNTNPKLYAIRYPHSIVNPRIIFFYYDGDKVCLLHAFKETSKKSSSEYDNAIKIAENRIKLIYNK